MAGYTAAMRIERIEIRSAFTARPAQASRNLEEPHPGVAVIELTGTDLGERLRSRAADLRIYLGQLTWYLFNSEGWR